jgi:hypothetical protein
MAPHSIENDLIAAKVGTIDISKNRESLRNALHHTAVTGKAQKKRQRIVRTIFSMGVTLGFVLGIGCVWMLQSAPEKKPDVKVATNLGTLWCTYSDNYDGGTSVVWPPESTSEHNNFVKSAPGYGNRGYAVRFRGKAGERSQEGFIGVSTVLGPPCPSSVCSGVNIQKYRKVRFKMKGKVSGGELVLLISNAETTSGERTPLRVEPHAGEVYEALLTKFVSSDWQTVTLDLRSDFTMAGNGTHGSARVEDVLADARNIKWHVRNAKGANVDVWIDDLEFF